MKGAARKPSNQWVPNKEGVKQGDLIGVAVTLQ
jgi:hypothetical protein